LLAAVEDPGVKGCEEIISVANTAVGANDVSFVASVDDIIAAAPDVVMD
jgi:hypothetical protein